MKVPLAKRPVLAGNGVAAVHVLDLMLEIWPADDLLVIAPSDPSRHDWQASLADAARARGVAVLQPERVNDSAVVDRLGERVPDLLLSVYYTQIFRPELLATVAGPALNFHPSLLPRHRGTAPLIWAIVEGATTTGVTVHHLTVDVDTGPIVEQRSLPIHPNDTGYTLHLKASLLVRGLAAGLLRRIANGDPLPSGRDQVGDASYHSRRDPAVNHINWTDERHRIRNIVRALAPPLPGAYMMVRDKRVLVESVQLIDAAGPARAPGMIEFQRSDGPAVVWGGNGPLLLERCQVDSRTVAGHDLPALLGIGDGEVAS